MVMERAFIVGNTSKTKRKRLPLRSMADGVDVQGGYDRVMMKFPVIMARLAE